MASESIPLLNDYKREFFWKRFPQTVLGGPRLLLQQKAPAYVYVSQLLLLLLPWALGGIFTVLAEMDVMHFSAACYVYGAVIIVFVFIIQITSQVCYHKSSSLTPVIQGVGNTLAEEDEIDFVSCCGLETVRFVVPPKKYKINVILHSLISGPVCGFSLWYLLPSSIGALYSESLVAKIFIFIFGWISLSFAQYSLTVTPAPETFVYRTADIFEITCLSRPFYILLLCIFHLLTHFWTNLVPVNQALHIVYVCLPLLWCLGVLPHIDSFILWALEQGLVSLFGGSPMATDLRLVIMAAVSIVVFVAEYFIPFGLHTVIIMSVVGYILSLDLSSLAPRVLRCCCKNNWQSSPESQVNTSFLWQWGYKEALFHVIMMVIIGGVAAAVNYYTVINTSTQDDIVGECVGYIVIGVLVIDLILTEVQRVYVFGGMWRNVLYPSSVQRTSVFNKQKRRLKVVAYLRRVIFDFVGPVLMVVYLCSSMSLTDTTLDTWYVHTAVSIMAASRAFRWVWQNTRYSLLEISLVHILNIVLPSSDTTWRPMGLPLQLLIVGLVCDRAGGLLNKVYTYLVIIVMSVRDKKQKRKSTPLILVLNIILFPLVAMVILVATALNAPLLPLFTLPIFLVGYPRPRRFWPEETGSSANVCQDTVYYKQAAAQIARALRDGYAAGSTGLGSVGSMQLFRFQDRMAWVQVVEHGYGYSAVSIKGLELQETSCHAVEATELDDMLEECFEHEKGVGCCVWNKHPMSILKPYDAANLKTYSDAKNQLTGLIDSPDVLQGISKGFVKGLVWVFLNYAYKEKDKEIGEAVRRKSTESHRPTTTELWKGMQQQNKVNVCNKNISNNANGDRDKGSVSPSGKSLADSDWGSDNDSLFGDSAVPPATGRSIQPGPQSGRRMLSPLVKPAKIPGTFEEDNNIDDMFKDLEFGMPAVDISQQQKPSPHPFFDNKKYKKSSAFHNVQVTNFSVPAASKLALPTKWTQIPLDAQKLQKASDWFPTDWYKHVICQFEFESTNKGPAEIALDVAGDKDLMKMYSNFVVACHLIVNEMSLDPGASPTPAHVHRVFEGQIPWSPALDWLTEDELLLELVLKAYRFGVKLSLDEMLLGQADTCDETQEYMEEYSANWYFGRQEDAIRGENVLAEKPQMFSLSRDTAQNTYNSRVLTLQDTPVYISSLNTECVRAQWANLSLELLYLTNDDEERYSIQAHPMILRNLTVQAADPPLGYPIYSSPLLSVPTL